MTYLSAPFLFMPTSQREAAAAIVAAVAGPHALTTFVGVGGAGKTTVLRRVAADLVSQRVRVIQVSDESAGGLGLTGLVSQVGGQADPAASLDEKRERAFEALTELDDDVERIALLVDDAQRLDPSALRYIQLACRSSPMLRVVLARSPDALGPLDSEEFAPLRERIAHRVDLAPLFDDEAAAFAAHLLHAGGVPARRALPPTTSGVLVRYGQGNPARISHLLRRSLALAVARNEAPLRPETVEQVVAAFDGSSSISLVSSVSQAERPPQPARRRRHLPWALAGLGVGASLALAVLLFAKLDSAISRAVPPPLPVPTIAPAPTTVPVPAESQASVIPDAPHEASSPITAAPSSHGPSAAAVKALPLPSQAEASRPPPEPSRASRPVRTNAEQAPELRPGGQRCRDIVLKAQLGDEISHEDRQFLRAGCPSGR